MIHHFSVGAFAENVYILERQGEPVSVFDPGAEAQMLINETLAACKRVSTNIVNIILTHGHLDHIAALGELHDGLENSDIMVYIFAPKADKCYFGVASMIIHEKLFGNLEALGFSSDVEVPDADIYFDDGFIIPRTKIKAISTPGHTNGSSSFIIEDEKSIISGDTLFRDGVGRTDFFDGDENLIINSIRNKLLSFDNETKVWPGHGLSTTIGRERQYFF